MKLIPVLACLAVCGVIARAQPQTCGPFSMTVSSGDGATLGCTFVSTNLYDLTVTANTHNGDNAVTCTVSIVSSGQSIRNATLTNSAGASSTLSVLISGSSTANDPLDVASVSKSGGNGAVVLEDLRLLDDLGSVSVDAAVNILVGDDLTGLLQILGISEQWRNRGP